MIVPSRSIPPPGGTHRYPMANRAGRILIATLMRALFTAVLLPAALAAQTEGVDYFEQHIRPLLAARCYGCHSTKLDKPMGGLLLDSRAGMLRGGKSGVAVVVAGKPEESLLIAAVNGNSKDLRMP